MHTEFSTSASLFLTNGIPLFVTAQTYTHVHLYFCVCIYYSISMITQIFDHSIYFLYTATALSFSMFKYPSI
uniref:Uncharacterized protein n=1 Tax=Siphoviridae sp. ct87j35 TaxID=2825356 RepID=A0A8S5V4I0_9CAUD|nr:MAG TPA: hypothetical protein [Siphoviridae sp. ct87j35]